MTEEKKTKEYEWRCLDCDAKAPGTSYGYMKFIRHQKGRHVCLVNVRP
jgi:hypothetical protein